VKWQDAEDSDGSPTCEFTLEPAGDRQVTGVVWIPSEINPGHPLILFGHGASGNPLIRSPP